LEKLMCVCGAFSGLLLETACRPVRSENGLGEPKRATRRPRTQPLSRKFEDDAIVKN
jgi:hypothetical protein